MTDEQAHFGLDRYSDFEWRWWYNVLGMAIILALVVLIS
jgi:hypothetical protein